MCENHAQNHRWVCPTKHRVQKQNFPGHYPRPHSVGLPAPRKTPVTPSPSPRPQQRGGSAPLLIPWLTMWSSRGKNITQPNILPLVFFFPQGGTGELSHLSNPAMPIVSLHQENFSELTDFFNASALFFKVPTFTSNTFLSSIISLTK